MRNSGFFRLALVVMIAAFAFGVLWAEEYTQVPLSIHISSTVSDGKYTIPEIVAIARENAIKAVVINDWDLRRWEYGIWPLRNIIKKITEESSILKYGVKRYLGEIEDAQQKNQDLVIIPGTESAPFYYWEGNIFAKNLKLCNWHKHLLTVGLDSAQAYSNLPVIGNLRGLENGFRVNKLWPVLFIALGFFCFKKRRRHHIDAQGRPSLRIERKLQVCGLSLAVIGLLFLLNNWPFCGVKYDQYHGDLGILPYQNFIDYVGKQGGLVFWAHPEAQNIQTLGGIKVDTREHTCDLAQANNYTGFAIWYEGYTKVGCPYGLWDEILLEYCRGVRKAPVWAIGGLSFDSAGDLGGYMQDLRNMLLVTALNKAEVLKALREGRFYVVTGKHSSEFRLDKFVIRDSKNNKEKTMGQGLDLSDKPLIQISGHFLNGGNQAFKIKLIKNAKIIQFFETSSPFDISYEDEYEPKDRKSYYRIEAESDGVRLVTNPIFVTLLKN